MLTLSSLTLRSKGHLSVPGREAGWRTFHLAAGYYKVPLNSTLGRFTFCRRSLDRHRKSLRAFRE